MKKFILLLVLVLLTSCSFSQKGEESKNTELTISAAASMQDVLNDIKVSFEKEHPTIKLAYNFGGSGALQQQISQGAPVDLFLSASLEKFNVLAEQGLLDETFQGDLLGNEIALITPKESKKTIKSFDDLKDKADNVAIGIPESVPVGKYAKETLQNLNVWEDIENKTVFAKDVRQVLTYVETGNVDAGIVYQTDAIQSEKIKVVEVANPSTHSTIVYPIGIIKSTNYHNEAKIFYNYLHSKQALRLFEEYGFIIKERKLEN